MRFLVTGGSGYLGTHLVSQLVALNNEVVVFDDFSGQLRTRFPSTVQTVQGSITDCKDLRELTNFGYFDGVFHLAAKKSVSESTTNPSLYWAVNVEGTRNLLDYCTEHSVTRIVSTSSAAVYGPSLMSIPIIESDEINPANKYGETKAAAEELINSAADASLISAFSLRSFNLAGASDPKYFDMRGENILPIILRSFKNGQTFEIFGDKFQTRDGTCIRDYVNVADVAEAHIRAMDYLLNINLGFRAALNISSGEGTSVKELIEIISKQLGQVIPWRISDMRQGDAPYAVGNNTRARSLIQWSPSSDIYKIVAETVQAFEFQSEARA